MPRDLPRGEIPDAADPPRGCSFHPRCPEATPICGWESRDLRAVLEEHWTRRSPEEYDAEKGLVGDLDHLAESAMEVSLGASNPEAVRGLIERMQREAPDEPLWKGVDAIEDEDRGVRIRFHAGEDPPLRRADGVEVACVLYPDPEGEAASYPG